MRYGGHPAWGVRDDRRPVRLRGRHDDLYPEARADPVGDGEDPPVCAGQIFLQHVVICIGYCLHCFCIVARGNLLFWGDSFCFWWLPLVFLWVLTSTTKMFQLKMRLLSKSSSNGLHCFFVLSFRSASNFFVTPQIAVWTSTSSSLPITITSADNAGWS